MSGWIKIHREIQDHWIWKDPVKLKWWLDILISVNHDDSKINLGMQVIDCKRGQSIMSLQRWANRWMVSKDKARNFLNLLKKDNMIIIETLSKTTRITVCKYDTYQGGLHDRQTIDKQLPSVNNTSYEEVQKPEKKPKTKKKKESNGDSLHSKARIIFEARFQRETREAYYWQPKDAGNMSQLLNAIKYSRAEKGMTIGEDDLLSALSAFLIEATKDEWIKKNLSVSVLFSKYNEIVSRAKASKTEKIYGVK